MPRAVRHVAEPEQVPLLDARVKLRLPGRIARVASPAYEMRNGSRGAVVVKQGVSQTLA